MTDANILQQVLARAIKDAAFRRDLVSNPKAVLAREYHVEVDDSVTIRVLEDTPTSFTLVLPPQATRVRELSDVDLETVAGGQQRLTNVVGIGTCSGCGTYYLCTATLGCE